MKILKAKTLHDAFVTKLQALYDIELQLIKALPKMAKKATAPELKKGFEQHLKETEEQTRRLEQAFKLLGEKPKKEKSEAIRGLVLDAEWVMKTAGTPELRDAWMVPAAQAVEHYEIACYGAAVSWAELMGHTEVAELLNETLEEEKMADEKLNMLALQKLNAKVQQHDEEDM